MRCGVYGRKPTDAVGADPDATSIERQIAGARAVAEARGCTILPEHISTDDAVVARLAHQAQRHEVGAQAGGDPQARLTRQPVVARPSGCPRISGIRRPTGARRAEEATHAGRERQTYTVEVTLTVYPHTDEHLRNERAIRDEVESWLTSLDATVDEISVQRRKGER